MEATTDHELEIARLVDDLAAQGILSKSSIADVATSLSFSMSEEETRFLVRYVIWKRDVQEAEGKAAGK
jgi:hypothetical protein